MDPKNYWKNSYEKLWEKADEKERLVKDLIEKLIGEPLEFYGLGAGSTTFKKGDAKDNNLEKGDADLYLKKYKTFIEVTGPMIKVREEDTLWVRPDKVRNGIRKLRKGICDHYFIIHVANLFKGDTLIRAIELNEDIVKSFNGGRIKQIYPVIRGKEESYLEIPYDHFSIHSMDEFKKILI